MGAELLATCWTFAGDIDPGAEDPASPLDPISRIEALERHGFSGADFLLGDLRGRDLDAIRAALDDARIPHRQIELVTGWWDDARSDSLDEALLMAREIGATQVKCAPDLDHADRPVAELRDAWVRFAERVADIGAQLVIEPMTFSNLPTVEDGARFVQAAGHANGGVLVDYWHVVRGGSTLASLRQNIDPAHLMAVELCDGSGPKPVGESLLTDATMNRRLPGEGDWDVRGFVRTIRDLAFRGPWGIEMSAPWFQALPLDDALARTVSASRQVLERAEP